MYRNLSHRALWGAHTLSGAAPAGAWRAGRPPYCSERSTSGAVKLGVPVSVIVICSLSIRREVPKSAIFTSPSRVIVPPVGLVGKFKTSALLFDVMARAIASAVTANPSLARHGTGTGTPCASEIPGA